MSHNLTWIMCVLYFSLGQLIMVPMVSGPGYAKSLGWGDFAGLYAAALHTFIFAVFAYVVMRALTWFANRKSKNVNS